MSENLFPLLTKLLKVSSKLKQTKIPEERRSATLDLFVKSVLSNENETRKHEGMPPPERCLHQHISFICVKSYCCEYEPTSLRVISYRFRGALSRKPTVQRVHCGRTSIYQIVRDIQLQTKAAKRHFCFLDSQRTLSSFSLGIV